jgi:formylmethanofuran dehydrogenase subunit E
MSRLTHVMRPALALRVSPHLLGDFYDWAAEVAEREDPAAFSEEMEWFYVRVCSYCPAEQDEPWPACGVCGEPVCEDHAVMTTGGIRCWPESKCGVSS